MFELLTRLARDKSGSIAAEYIFVCLLIALAILPGVMAVGSALCNLYAAIGARLQGAVL